MVTVIADDRVPADATSRLNLRDTARFRSMASGEAIQHIGINGVERAKRWLEATTRVLTTWTNPDDEIKLTFKWASKGTFSFDLGGEFYGGDLHKKHFFAEVKKYKAAGDQGTEYPKYLAKCYLALKQNPAFCDHFLWITWSPFSMSKWPELLTADYVETSVRTHDKKTLGAAGADPEVDHCKAVAERLWLIVLSDRQERLNLSDEDRAELFKLRVIRGGI